MGMSGVGKTYLSGLLKAQGWYHYSCDYQIGQAIDAVQNVAIDDLSELSRYVGMLGDLPYDEFMRRQAIYFEAECESLRQLQSVVRQAIKDGFNHVINDSTGSLCEINDEVLLDMVDENSLIVYLKASEQEEQEVLQRAQDYPKPLFYSPEKLDGWIASYLNESGLESSAQIDASDFARWVFPKLFENRLPKYQRIADKYGVTIPSEAFHGIKSDTEFLDIVTEHLPDAY